MAGEVPIAIGSVVTGRLTQSRSADSYTFTVATRATYSFFSSGNVDTRATLYGANYNFLFSNSDAGEGNNFAITQLLDPGVYYLEVSGEGFAGSGDYEVHLEGPGAGTFSDDHGFSPWSATQVLLGSTTAGLLKLSDDRDFFKFSVATRATYSFFSSGNVDTRATLYGANYNFLFSNSDAGEGNNFAITQLLDPGVYYLEVSGEGFAGSGDYSVHLGLDGRPGGLKDSFRSIHLGKHDFSREMARLAKAAYEPNAVGRGADPLLPLGDWQPVNDLQIIGSEFSNGVFKSTIGGAAAHLYVGEVNGLRTLAVAFRGTNDPSDVIDYQMQFLPHLGRFAPLFQAIDRYIASSAIESVYVSGHSLGGAIAQYFMAAHPDAAKTKYIGATFGSPGAGAVGRTDPRLAHYEHYDDPVPELGLATGNHLSGYKYEIDLLGNSVTAWSEHYVTEYIETLDALSLAGFDITPTGPGSGVNNPEPLALYRGTNESDTFNAVGVPLLSPRVSLILGRAGEDKLSGSLGSDILYGGPQDDSLDGEIGTDTAFFGRARSDYTITFGTNEIIVAARAGNEGTDILKNIERLVFTDRGIAIDLNGAAGIVARTLGAVFGKSSVGNPEYVGIGLALADSGMSAAQIMQVALDARLGRGAQSSAVVSLLYSNVVGVAPAPTDLDYFVELIANGAHTATSLGVMASTTNLNESAIGLVGLTQTGLEFIPFGG